MQAKACAASTLEEQLEDLQRRVGAKVDTVDHRFDELRRTKPDVRQVEITYLCDKLEQEAGFSLSWAAMFLSKENSRPHSEAVARTSQWAWDPQGDHALESATI